MKIKAILFDMDGVLIDARDWHYQALNEAPSLLVISLVWNLIYQLLMVYQHREN